MNSTPDIHFEIITAFLSNAPLKAVLSKHFKRDSSAGVVTLLPNSRSGEDFFSFLPSMVLPQLLR